MSDKYIIGIDYGTLSGRAAIFRVSDGYERGSAVKEYTHGAMEDTLTAGDGQKLPPDFSLQVPADYIEVLEQAVPAAIKDSGVNPADIIGLGIDFTSATVIPCLEDGTPLNELPEFKNEPHAYVKLWKHHGAEDQTARLLKVAQERGEDWLARYGGLMSSEMLMPKTLETLEKAPEVYNRAKYVVNALDWITWKLTGNRVYAAGDSGYKRQYQDGKYPSREYLAAVNPDFADVFETKLAGEVVPLGSRVGGLTAEFAKITGLPEGIAVAAGNIDAHVTAAAVKAVDAGQLTAILGTSNVYVVNGKELREVPGMFGVVDGGIVDGLWAFEAGQTGAGDILAWFVNHCVPEEYQAEARERGLNMHELLTEKAAEQKIGQHGLLALDWHNGNRSILVDSNLSGVIFGQTLATRAEDQYRALMEATAFGMRVIIEAFVEAGVEVNEIVAAGGLLKNKWLMQTFADVTKLPLSVGTTAFPGALGSAVYCAVATGSYPNLSEAAAAMGGKIDHAYEPNPQASALYDEIYAEYKKLHDYFGRGGSDVLYKLKDMRRAAFARK